MVIVDPRIVVNAQALVGGSFLFEEYLCDWNTKETDFSLFVSSPFNWQGKHSLLLQLQLEARNLSMSSIASERAPFARYIRASCFFDRPSSSKYAIGEDSV